MPPSKKSINKYTGGKEPHRWRPYFEILNEYRESNSVNKLCICKECKKIKGDDAYKVTNTKKCCRQHLKQCIHIQTSLSVEEYDKLLSEIKEDEIYDKNKRDINKHLKTDGKNFHF